MIAITYNGFHNVHKHGLVSIYFIHSEKLQNGMDWTEFPPITQTCVFISTVTGLICAGLTQWRGRSTDYREFDGSVIRSVV